MLSRRSFLKSASLGGLALPAVLQNPTPPDPAQFPVLGGVTHWWGEPLGRVLLNVMTVYQAPSWRAKATGVYYYYDDVVQVLGAVGGEGLYSNNHTWLQTPDGFIYASWVQPCGYFDQNPVQPIGEGGAWGIVTVPITYGRSIPSVEAWGRVKLTYNTTNRIIGTEGEFYKVREIYGYEYYVQAAHMRVMAPEEVGPINAHVPAEAKHVEIAIGEQMLYAFEGGNVVYQARVSTGAPSSPTPHGEWRVIDKRHGQRMTGGVGAGAYNLPGIPWICYFTYGWIATHGAYWHNDYGRLHSNGCINMRPEDARWLFRWTTPTANYWDYRTQTRIGETEPGTRIVTRW